MAYIQHRHPVYDTDLHYVIDPITRQIKSECGKVQFMQYDHNSERITFAIPRYVDGHDMSWCNASEVHYINTSKSDKTVFNADVYPIVDLQVHPEDDQVVIGSWLISQNATEYCGSLAFIVRFACIEDTEITYQWHTDIYKDIKIVSGIYNTNVVTNDNDSDVLAAWKKEIFEMMDPYFEEARTNAEIAANAAVEAGNYAETAIAEARNAEISADRASEMADKAAASQEVAAISEANAKESAEIARQITLDAKLAEVNAMIAETNARLHAEESADSAEESAEYSQLSKSWAVGNTGVRIGENTNNSKYYSEAARSIHTESLNALDDAKEMLAEATKVYTNVEFSFDFETGELVYASPSYAFSVNTETGNLEWEVA